MNSNYQKGILLALALFFSQASLAIHPTPSSCLYCDRFYIGAMVGAMSVMDRQSTNLPTRSVHYLSAMGPQAGGVFGFNLCLYDQVRFDLEGYANVPSVQMDDNQDYAPQSSYTVKMRYSLGVRGLPTYEFTPETAGHLILGYSYGKFSIRDTGNYGYVNKMFGQSGYQLGFGMETFMSKWWLLRGDVIYTGYPWQTTNGVTTTTPASTQLYRNSLSTLEADLTFIYKLGQM